MNWKNIFVELSVFIVLSACMKEEYSIITSWHENDDEQSECMSFNDKTISFIIKEELYKESETKADSYSDFVKEEKDYMFGYHSEMVSISDSVLKTRASKVTSLSSFNVLATTGSSSESLSFASTSFTAGSGSVFSSSRLWPDTNPGYHFYASNQALTFASSGTYIASSQMNDIDVLVAYSPSPTYLAQNTLSFNHILGFISQTTITASANCTLSNISIQITPKKGDYNIKTGNWSSLTEDTPVVLSSSTGSTTNNLVLTPGEYTISLNWRVSYYGWAYTRSATETINISAGKSYSINITLGIKASPQHIAFKAGTGCNGEITFVTENSDGCDIYYCYSNVDYYNRSNWTKWDYSALELTENGPELFFSGVNTKSSLLLSHGIGQFVWTPSDSGCTQKLSVSGKPAFLLCGWNSSSLSYASHLFENLFKDMVYLYDASEMVIDNTKSLLSGSVLNSSNFKSMFEGCTSLRNAPSFTSTYVGFGCYYTMFKGCSSLINIPTELPASTLEGSCYYGMFQDCISITYTPLLMSTQLADMCYSLMFQNCTSLITTQEILPATTLTNGCYKSMYRNTNITTAPILPATELVRDCYNSMFSDCSRLNYVKALFTTTPTTSVVSGFTYNWLENVSSSGIFVKNASATWNLTGPCGIPSGWTVETYTP